MVRPLYIHRFIGKEVAMYPNTCSVCILSMCILCKGLCNQLALDFVDVWVWMYNMPFSAVSLETIRRKLPEASFPHVHAIKFTFLYSPTIIIFAGSLLTPGHVVFHFSPQGYTAAHERPCCPFLAS